MLAVIGAYSENTRAGNGHTMAVGRTLSTSFWLTLYLWLLFPGPCRGTSSTVVPPRRRVPTRTPVRRMVPGDHLQLVYNYRLFSDMLTGHTPWFYNLYEFNTGNECRLR